MLKFIYASAMLKVLSDVVELKQPLLGFLGINISNAMTLYPAIRRI